MINTKRRAVSNEKTSKHEEQTKKIKTEQNPQKVLKAAEPKVENNQKKANKDKNVAKKNEPKQAKQHYEAVTKPETVQEPKKANKADNKKEEQKVNKNQTQQKQKVAKTQPAKEQNVKPTQPVEKQVAQPKQPKIEKKEVNNKLPILEGLELGYVVCEGDKRFSLLHTFLRKFATKKFAVLFNHIHSVKFFSDLLSQLDIRTLVIDETDSQEKKLATLKEASENSVPVFLCAKNATLELFKNIQLDWLVSYEAPLDTAAYLNLANQVVKSAPETSKTLLFVIPSDIGYLRYLGTSKAELKEFEFPNHKLVNIQSQCEKAINKNFYLNCAARDAFRSFINGYVAHPLKDIFDAKKLDLEKLVKSFALNEIPHIALDEESARKPVHTGRKKVFG